MHEDMNAEFDRDTALAELTLVSTAYQYRDQLIVTEFALSMTVISLAGSLVTLVEGIIQIAISLAISIFALIIANHMARVNDDREVAGSRVAELQELLKMVVVHQGNAEKRSGGIPGLVSPITMVWFAWAVAVCSLVTTIFIIISLLVSNQYFCLPSIAE